ncbi:MAG: exodeoxyribonuclease VII small subunit [Coriobacteriia bacterium]|nr:exodeoxyribonuclease VII small subunit [Coriobacteriia bacterium]
MTEEPRTFTQARARLEEIVTQVRKKDTSLEKSLDLLEEGVKLANQCTELIDHADWEDAGSASELDDADSADETADGDSAPTAAGADDETTELN